MYNMKHSQHFRYEWRTQGAPRTAATLGYGMQRRWRKSRNGVGTLKTKLSIGQIETTRMEW